VSAILAFKLSTFFFYSELPLHGFLLASLAVSSLHSLFLIGAQQERPKLISELGLEKIIHSNLGNPFLCFVYV